MRFQKQIVTHQLTLPIAIGLSVALWAIAYSIRSIADLRETLGALVLYGIIGYLLIILNQTFAIIRLRASIQTVVFWMLVAVITDIHQLYAGNIMALCFISSMFLVFNTYQLEKSAGLLFHAFIALGIASLLVPKVVWLFPFIWYACFTFRSLNVKSFIASLFGWSIPIGTYATYLFWQGNIEEMLMKANQMVECKDLTLWWVNLPLTVTFVYLFILYIASAVHSLKQSLDEKVQARNFLQFIILLTLALFLLMASMPSDVEQILPLTIILISILQGHFLAIADSKWSNAFFIFSLVCLIPVFILNLEGA